MHVTSSLHLIQLASKVILSREIICEVVWGLSWGQDYTHPSKSFSSVSYDAQAVPNISARLHGESDSLHRALRLDCNLLSQPTGVETNSYLASLIVSVEDSAPGVHVAFLLENNACGDWGLFVESRCPPCESWFGLHSGCRTNKSYLTLEDWSIPHICSSE